MRKSAVALLPVLVLLAGSCVEHPPAPLAGNLLAEREPTASPGVSHPERLADGLAPPEGDFWLTGITSRVAGSGHIEWDLGATKPIRCALLQGDNNDSYILTSSNDGTTWQPLWTAEPVNGAGMRLRQAKLDATARYVRLIARGGDGSYSVGEIALFAECPAGFPDVKLVRAEGVPLNSNAHEKLVYFGLAALAFVVFQSRRRRWAYLLGAGAVLLGLFAVADIQEIGSFANSEEESLLRAIVAVLAGVLVIKETFAPEAWRPTPRTARATLAVLAVLAFGCYYHFLDLQFRDHAKGRKTLVHTFDMRHYFPSAKYFKELRYDGLYLGSLAAYLDVTGAPPESVKNVNLRDLTTYDMIKGEQALPQLPAIRARFSPERWEEFKRDMKYLVDTMGRGDYLGSMQDHGGNATPVWHIAGWLVLSHLPGNELTLSLTGLIDPVLLLLFFFVLYRTFGLRVMLYTVVLFGATDFYQFGSNLVGSTLRQDWLVALGLGACALKTGRRFLGGFLIAYGGLIRAFPAVAAMFLVVPVLWFAIDWWRERKRLPDLATVRSQQASTLRAIAGAAVAVVGLVGLSSLLFGLRDAWGTWISKISLHATGPSTNNVGLRNVLAWRPWTSAGHLRRDFRDPWQEWHRLQIESFAQLRPLFYLVNLVAFALVFLACRKRPLHQVALLGLLLVPFLFYPSNYYCHFVFLLPLALAPEDQPLGQRDRNFGWTVAVLCAMCVGQYATYSEGWTDLRYTYQSFVLLIGFLAIMVPLAGQTWRTLRPRAAPTAPAPESDSTSGATSADNPSAAEPGAGTSPA
jgi:hypothetical protein